MTRAPIHGIEVFLAIVTEGSLAAAARSLGVGSPAVSLQLRKLEEQIGVGLLHRTTRSIELTEAGRTLFEAAAPAYRDIVYAVKKTEEMASATTGTLRLSLSRGAFIAAVAPALQSFQDLHPGIRLDISLNEALADINREGFHAGIRLGDSLSPEMVAVRVTPPLRAAFSAAPAYLDAHGRPDHPRDLLNHACLRYRMPTADKLALWRFVEEGQEKEIDPPSQLVFDHVIGVIDAARHGFGIGLTFRASIAEHLQSGALESVLDPFARQMPPFYLYYPEQNRRLECLRLFIDHLVAHRDAAASGQ